MNDKSYRIAALFSHPIQYFAPLFRYIESLPEFDLSVYFCSKQGLEAYNDLEFGTSIKWDIPLLDGYSYQFMPNYGKGKGFFSLFNPQIISEIFHGEFDAIWVHGYARITNWMAFLAARTKGLPILLRGESNLLRQRPWSVRLGKMLWLRSLLSQVTACLYIGKNNREYWEHYGANRNKLFFMPYVVNNDFFQERAKYHRPDRNRIREEFGIKDERPIILFCGKLVPWKQPLLLLEAYSHVRREFPCALLFVGDGVLRSQMEDRIASESINDVYIAGFKNQSEVSKAYTAADILTLPSADEPWGLVINEGMNFGLPVVTTNRVGCAVNLVQQQVNGFVVSHDRVDEFADALESLVSNQKLRLEYGANSLSIIQKWNFGRCVDGLKHAMRQVC